MFTLLSMAASMYIYIGALQWPRLIPRNIRKQTGSGDLFIAAQQFHSIKQLGKCTRFATHG